MAAINITGATAGLRRMSLSELSVTDFLVASKPLILYIIGMTVYAVFVFKFYRFLARRDILELETEKYYSKYEGAVEKFFRSVFYVLENLVLIPVLVFFWFLVLSVLLMFLSKNTGIDMVLLMSASIVAAVRITSYYNENLSQDLAKLIPFALLCIFLVENQGLSTQTAVGFLRDIPAIFSYMVYYLLFVACLELVLRVLRGIGSLFIRREKELRIGHADE